MEPDKVVVKGTPEEEDEDDGHEPEDLVQDGKLADKIPGKDSFLVLGYCR